MTRKEEKLQLIYKDESYAIVGANFGHYPRMEYERLVSRSQEPIDVCL